jgi:hypothetical protein
MFMALGAIDPDESLVNRKNAHTRLTRAFVFQQRKNGVKPCPFRLPATPALWGIGTVAAAEMPNSTSLASRRNPAL